MIFRLIPEAVKQPLPFLASLSFAGIIPAIVAVKGFFVVIFLLIERKIMKSIIFLLSVFLLLSCSDKAKIVELPNNVEAPGSVGPPQVEPQNKTIRMTTDEGMIMEAPVHPAGTDRLLDQSTLSQFGSKSIYRSIVVKYDVESRDSVQIIFQHVDWNLNFRLTRVKAITPHSDESFWVSYLFEDVDSQGQERPQLDEAKAIEIFNRASNISQYAEDYPVIDANVNIVSESMIYLSKVDRADIIINDE